MNLSEGHHIMAAHPFSYVIFCCFLSTPILCRKTFSFASENGGGSGIPLLPVSTALYLTRV